MRHTGKPAPCLQLRECLLPSPEWRGALPTQSKTDRRGRGAEQRLLGLCKPCFISEAVLVKETTLPAGKCFFFPFGIWYWNTLWQNNSNNKTWMNFELRQSQAQELAVFLGGTWSVGTTVAPNKHCSVWSVLGAAICVNNGDLTECFVGQHSGFGALHTTLNPEGFFPLYVARKTRSRFKVGIRRSDPT